MREMLISGVAALGMRRKAGALNQPEERLRDTVAPIGVCADEMREHLGQE